MKASTMIMFPYVATSVWDVFVSPVADQATEDCEVWESPDSEKSGSLKLTRTDCPPSKLNRVLTSYGHRGDR
jgi:hypothetical protein